MMRAGTVIGHMTKWPQAISPIKSCIFDTRTKKLRILPIKLCTFHPHTCSKRFRVEYLSIFFTIVSRKYVEITVRIAYFYRFLL